MNRAARQNDLTLAEKVQVGHVCREEGIVRLDRRTEKQRRSFPQRQRQLRQETRAAIVDSMFAEAGRTDVSIPVEYCKHRPIFEYANAFLNWWPAGCNVEFSC